jgi:SAM-dependent methyltransferase
VANRAQPPRTVRVAGVSDFRVASLQSWSSVASDWGELISLVDRQLQAAATWMLDAAAIQPGERVLELAGGPGTLSLMAARAVGSEGKVICTDFSEPMVETARRRSEAEGALGIECRVMDAEAIDLPDGAVDVVLCRMGYMFTADPATAFREAGRVLDHGGRLALGVWSGPEANPWAAIPMRAIMRHLDAPPPPPDAPGLWALADERRLRTLLTDGALRPDRIETIDDHVEYDSPEAWTEITGRLAGPVRALLDNLDDDGRAAITATIAAEAGQYRQPDGKLAVPERMVVASARRE